MMLFFMALWIQKLGKGGPKWLKTIVSHRVLRKKQTGIIDITHFGVMQLKTKAFDIEFEDPVGGQEQWNVAEPLK